MALMRIDQVGLSSGVPGRARNDGKSDGSEVTLTDLTPGGQTRFEILFVDPEDATALVSLGPTADSHVWKFVPTVGVRGGIRIRLTHTTPGGVTTTQIRIFGIADGNGNVKPVPGERSDPNATMANATDPAVIDKCERNWPTDEFPAGNPFGWGLEMNKLLRGFEDAAQQELIDELVEDLGELSQDSQTQAAAIAAVQAVNVSQSATLSSQGMAIASQGTAIASQDATLGSQATAIASQSTAIGSANALLATHTTELHALRDDTDELASLADLHSSSLSSQQAQLTSVLSSVTNLSRRIPTSMDLRDFVSGLNDGNIDGAIEAAKTAAYGLTDGVGFGGPGVIIKAPRGKWLLAQPHVFPAPGEYEVAVSFEGAGMNETIFLAATDAEASSVFTFGTYAPGIMMPHTAYLRVRGFSVLATVEGNTKRHGLTLYGPICSVLSDVRVRGFRAPDATWAQGGGIRILETLSDGVPVNSQFPTIRDCDIYGCMIGLHVIQAGPILVENSNFQGSALHNVVADGVSGTFRHCGLQGGVQDDANEPWGLRKFTPFVTGWSRTAGLPNGTGATCSAAAGQLCTVTGLSSLLGAGDLGAAGNKSHWLELTPSGSSSNERKVAGIYKIENVLSSTSCTIRKASNHASQGGLAFQVRRSVDNKIAAENCYDEGHDKIAMFGFYGSVNPTSTLSVSNSTLSATSDVEAMIEAQDCFRVETHGNNVTNTPQFEARLRWVAESNLDATRLRVDADDASHPGVVCRSAWMTDSQKIPSKRAVGMHDSMGGHSVRLRSAMEELGFVEAWDARVPSSITIAGGKAQAMVGLINGTVLGPKHAGVYPDYVANDPAFGGPCIANVPGAGTGGSFRGVIAANKLPAVPYGCLFMIVGRLESPTTGPSDPLSVSIETASGLHLLGLNDGVWRPSGFAVASSGGGTGFLDTPVDTNPHVFVLGRSVQGNNAVSTDNGDDYNRSGFIALQHAPGNPMTVIIGGGGVHTYTYRWVLMGVKPGPFSPHEHRRFVDLARNEWPLSR